MRDEVEPRDRDWCTTGLIALAWLLREFEVIHTVGWFQGESAHVSTAFERHYDAPAAEHLKCHHDVRAEARFFRRWVEAGRVVELETVRGGGQPGPGK